MRDDEFSPLEKTLTLNIPMPIVQLKTIAWGAKAVYGRLYRYAGVKGVAFPHVQTLADELSMSERQCRSYLQDLVDAGLIRVTRTFHGSRFAGNVYSFRRHECLQGIIGESRRIGQPWKSEQQKERDRIREEKKAEGSQPPPKIEGGQLPVETEGCELPLDRRQLTAGLLKEEEKNTEETTTNTAPAAQDVGASAKDENQNPDARQEAQTNTQVAPGSPQMGVEAQDADSARAEITGIYRQAKGAKRPKWTTKQGAANLEKLASLLEDLGYDTVIAAIRAYAQDFQPDAAFLKDKPLDWILTRERILKFAGETTMPRREAPAAPDASAPPRTTPTTPQASHEPLRSLDTLLKPASEIKAPGFRDPDVLGFWNATMPPQCQAPVMTAGLKQFLVACSAEPEFVKRWRDLVKLAAQVAASGKPKFKLTLSWFLRDGWAKLANHEFDWALPEDAAPVSGETPAEDEGEPYGVMDRDAIESAIATMTRLPFITPERRDDIIDQRNHLRKVWDTQGGEPAYRELAYYIRKNLTRAEQAAWFPKISHMARKRLVEVVEKFKI